MKAEDHVVLAHHQPAATMWGRGGKDYDEVSFAISDALAHAAQRLNSRAGELILDVATGTGWSARNVARGGAMVTGVDISPELLAAAADLSGHIRPPIKFRLGDAEQLPFDDGTFDGIISTFGVMFAIDQAAAAAELGRVCRSGGRLVLATWTPEGAVAKFFSVIAQHSDAPPPPSSPLAWGDPAHVEKLLGKAFELKFEQGISNAYHGSAEDIWDWYTRGFGPLRQLAESLPPDRLERLKRDVDAYHQHQREGKLARVKSKLELISKLLEFENEDKSKVPPVATPAGSPQLSHVGPPPNASVAPTPLAQMIGLRKVG